MENKLDESLTIICPTLGETKKVILILFSYGYHWFSGVTDLNPYNGLYIKNNVIYTNIIDKTISYSDLDHKYLFSNGNEIFSIDFINKY